jgi:hypothetical protein
MTDLPSTALRLLGLVCLLVILTVAIYCKPSHSGPRIRHLQQQQNGLRSVQESTPYSIQLILRLEYLSETSVAQIETMDPANSVVSHFCMAVNEQVSVCWRCTD